jgi:hypothetical protein
MAIRKQDFYEGAALCRLVRRALRVTLWYDAPFFVVDDQLTLYLKYSTRVRSPWGFTVTPSEQELLADRARVYPTIIGLVCGSDGVAMLDYSAYENIAYSQRRSVRISCARKHAHSYAISGPNGVLDRKVPPSDWDRLLLPRSR